MLAERRIEFSMVEGVAMALWPNHTITGLGKAGYLINRQHLALLPGLMPGQGCFSGHGKRDAFR